MAKQKRPEQRSAKSSTPLPDQSAPQPTGDEVFDQGGAAAPAAGPAGPAGGEEENLARMQALAAEYYERLTESAAQLTEQAQQLYGSSQSYVQNHPGPTVSSAFVVGLLVGLLVGRD